MCNGCGKTQTKKKMLKKTKNSISLIHLMLCC